MKIINWGIIGLGNIAHEFSKAFAKTKNAKLLAIASKNENKLKKFREQFNVELKFSFKNYQDLIDCDEVDIVYIALPNSMHKHWILNAIKNKKNILVEKPATINFSEANEIRDHLSGMLSEKYFNFDRDIASITVNRWAHGYSYGNVSKIAIRPFGRITIANSDASGSSLMNKAIEEAYRAVQELIQ